MGGLGKIKGYKQCSFCGKNVPIYHKKRLEYKNIFCNKQCEFEYKKSLTELNCECEICHKLFHRKQSQIDKYKHHYCSEKCHALAKMEYMKGENNHQYGLKGQLNSTWKQDERISNYGYRLIRKLDHPFKNSDDMVFEHRLVAEQYLLTDENRIIINGQYYLSDEFHVHHLDFDRLNNNPNNLYVISKYLHMKFHASLRFEAKKINNNNKCKVEEIFTKEELIKKFFEFIDSIENTKE